MLRHRHIRRRKPTLLMPNPDSPRRVSRLDLFFDLIFVVIFRQLFAIITGDMSLGTIWEYTLYFIPLWTIWQAVTFYSQRFEDTTIRHRWYMFLIIGLLTFVAISIHSELANHLTFFVRGIVCIEMILAYLIFSASSHGCDAAKNADIDKRLLGVLAWMHVGIALSRSLVRRHPEWFGRIVLSTVVIELGTFIVLANHKNNDLPQFDLTHLSERYGLFIMIGLAELVYAIVEGMSIITQYTSHLLLIEIALLGIAFGIWWLYFDQITYRPLKDNKTLTLLRAYLHLPLNYLIVLFGGIVLYLVESSSMQSTDVTIRWFFTITFVGILLTIGALSWFHLAESAEDKTVSFLPTINRSFIRSKVIATVACIGVYRLTRHSELRVFLLLHLAVLGALNLQGVWFRVHAQVNDKSVKNS